MTLDTYGSHRPTQFDSHIALDDREDWLLVPCSRTRDSDCLTESNFHAALTLLGGESDTVEVHRFGHWGPGWYEIILCAPGSEAAERAESIVNKLDGYPVLDEEDFCQREQEAADETWEHCYSQRERIRYVREHRSQFEFRSFSEMLSCLRGKFFAGYASEILN